MITLGLVAGETLDSVKHFDIKNLNRVYRGFQMRREIHNNDLLTCGHYIVAKNVQAFSSDSSKFSEPIDRLIYTEQDEEINNIVEMANNFNMSRDVVRKQILKGGER